MTTKALEVLPSTAAQTFKIIKNSLTITENTTVTAASGAAIKITNVQTMNGIIHTVNRVLKPNL